jgi:hypothetical protein
MERQNTNDFLFKPEPSAMEEPQSFSNKNTVIIVLLSLLLLSFLGINLLSVSGDVFQSITNIFGPLIGNILSLFGYTTGSVLNKTADVVGTGAKTGVDIASGTIHSVGDLLKNASQNQVDTKARSSLDAALNNKNASPPPEPSPTPAENPVQKPISSSKSQWCLVGEYKEKRGCIEVSESDKCLSGQVYPSQKMCLNPTLTTNA